jgi:hypothetical protein
MIQVQQSGTYASDQSTKAIFPLDQWQVADVFPSDLERIEGVKETIGFLRHQVVKLAAPILIETANLAIED